MTGPYVDGYLAMKPGIPEIGEFDEKAQQAYLLEPAGQEIGWTAMPDVGRFVVAALLHPGVSRNKALKVHSVVVSQTDISEEFERQTGKKWSVGYTTSEGLRMYESQAWKDDSPLKATCSLRRLWLRGETLYPEFDNAALGNSRTLTLAEVVAQNLGKAAA